MDLFTRLYALLGRVETTVPSTAPGRPKTPPPIAPPIPFVIML